MVSTRPARRIPVGLRTSVHRFRRPAVACLVLLTFWPTLVFGQSGRAGLVTTLQGTVTVRRAVLPQPVPLKFKDDVFVHDRVETAERSLVRLLLGGAALVTIRERTTATITEVPGRSTINLDTGKIGVAVAEDKLRPGDMIEIRTLNALAGIRGTVVVAEVTGSASDPSALTTNFHVLSGSIDVVHLDPTTQAPLSPAVSVGAGQTFSATGTTSPTVEPSPPVATVTSGLSPEQPQHTQAANQESVTTQAIETAVALAQVITGTTAAQTVESTPPAEQTDEQTQESSPQEQEADPVLTESSVLAATAPLASDTFPTGGITTEPTPVIAPIIPITNVTTEIISEPTPVEPLPALDPLPPPPPALSYHPIVVNGTVIGQTETIDGTLVLLSGDMAGVTSPLLIVTNSDLTITADSVIDFQAALTATLDGSALIAVDPTRLSASGNLLSVGPGASLTLAGGGLFSDEDSAAFTGSDPGIHVAGQFLLVEGALTSTGPHPVLSFSGSQVTVGGDLVRVSGGQTSAEATLVVAGATVIDGTTVDSILSIGGRLVGVSAGTLILGSSLAELSGATLTTAGPLFQATGATLAPSMTTPFLSVTGGSVTSSGPLVDLTGSSLNLGGQSLLALAGGADVTVANAPLLRLSAGASATIGAPLVSLGMGGGTLTVNNTLAPTGVIGGVPIAIAPGAVANVTVNLDALGQTGALVLGDGASLIAFAGGIGSITLGTPAAGAISLQQISVLDAATANIQAPFDQTLPFLLTGVAATSPQPVRSISGVFTGPATALVQIQNANLSTPGSVVTGNAAVDFTAPILQALQSTIVAGGAIFALLAGELTLADSTAALTITGGSVTTAGNLANLTGGATVTLSGSFLSMSGTPVTSGADFVDLSGVSVELAGSLIDVAQGAGGPITLAMNNLGNFLRIVDGADITKTGAAALVRVIGSEPNGVQVLASGNLILLGASGPGLPGANLTLSGPLLDATNARLTSGDPDSLARTGVAIHHGSRVTKADATPLLVLDGVDIRLSGSLLGLRRSAAVDQPSLLDLGMAPLLVMTNSTVDTSSLGFFGTFGTIQSSCCTIFSVRQGAQLLATGAGPLIQLTDSILRAGPDEFSGGNVFGISETFGGAPGGELVARATVSLAGPLLSATDSTVSALFDLLNVNASSLTSTGAAPLITLDGASGTTVTLGAIRTDPLVAPGTTAAGRILSLFGRVGSPGLLTLSGPLFSAHNATVTTTSEGFRVGAGGVLTMQDTADALIILSGGSVTTGGHLVHVTAVAPGGSVPGSMSLSGGLLDVTDTVIEARGNLVRIADGASLTSTSLNELVRFQGGSYRGGPLGSVSGASLLRMFSQTGQSESHLTLAGPYIMAVDATFQSPDAPVFNLGDGARIVSSSDRPFASFTGGSVTSVADLFALVNNTSFTTPGSSTTFGSGVAPTMQIAGTLIEGTGTTFAPQGPFLRLTNGASLEKTGPAPLVWVDGGSITAGNNLFSLHTTAAGLPAPSLTLAGSLIRSVEAQLSSGTPGVNAFTNIFIADGSTVSKMDDSPLLQLESSVLTTAGNVLTLRRSPSAEAPSTLALGEAYLLDAVASSFTTVNPTGGGTGEPCCSTVFIGQGGVLTSTNPGALIRLTDSTVNSGGNDVSGGTFFVVTDTGQFPGDTFNLTTLPSTVTLSGGLVRSVDSTVSALFRGLGVTRSSITAGSELSPVFSLANTTDIVWSFGGITPLPIGTLPAGGQTYGAFFIVIASVPADGPRNDATAAFHGPLLVTTNTGTGTRTTFNVTGDFIGVFSGATLTSDTALPFVRSERSTFNVGIDSGTGAPFRSFLSVGGIGGADGMTTASATFAGPLLDSRDDRFVFSGALVNVFAGGRMDLDGRLLAATDGTVITSGGPLVNVGGFGRLTATTALPLLDIAGNSVLTLGGSLAALGGGATLATAGPLLRATEAQLNPSGLAPFVQVAGSTLSAGETLIDLVGSSLTLNGQPLAGLTSGGALLVLGDGVRLSDGAALTISNAPILSVAGGSIVVIRDALVAFGGTSDSSLTVNNAFAPTVVLGGIPVFIAPGAEFDIEIGPDALAGLDQGILNITGSLLVVEGGTVRIATAGTDLILGDVALGPGATLRTLDGVLVRTMTSPLVDIVFATVTQLGSGTDALVLITPTADISLNSPLLAAVNSSLTTTGSVLRMEGGVLADTSSAPLLRFAGTSVTAGANVVLIRDGAELAIAGSLIEAIQGAGGPVTLLTENTRSFVAIQEDAHVTKTGPAPLIHLVGAVANGVSVLASGHFLFMGLPTSAEPGPAPTLTLSGPLLQAVNSLITTGDRETLARTGIGLHDGTVVTKTDATPFIVLDGAVLRLASNVVSVRRSPAVDEPTLLNLGAAPLLVMTNGSVVDVSTLGFQAALGTIPNACCSGFSWTQGARLLATGADPLIQIVNSTFRSGPDQFSGGTFFSVSDTFGGAPAGELVAPATISLGGPLLSATVSTISSLFHLLGVTRSSLTSTTTDPLIVLTNSMVTLGGIDPVVGSPSFGLTTGRLLSLTASATTPASLELAGPLLQATDTTIVSTSDLLGIFNGATLTSTTTDPLVSLVRGSLTTAQHLASTPVGRILSMTGTGLANGEIRGAALSLQGPLLSAVDTTLVIGNPALGGNLSLVFFLRDGATLTSTTQLPLLSFMNTVLDASGTFFDMRAGARVTLEGPLVVATNNSQFNTTTLGFAPGACCLGFRIGSGIELVANHPTEPLIQLTNSVFNSGPDLQSGQNFFLVLDTGSAGDVPAPATVTLQAPLLRAIDSTITSTFSFVGVTRSTLTSATDQPLIQIQGGTVQAGGFDISPLNLGVQFGSLFTVSAFPANSNGPATVSLAGPLLIATDATLAATSEAFGVFNGATLTSSTDAALIQLHNSSLIAGAPAPPAGAANRSLINIGGLGGPGGVAAATLTLSGAGGLLQAVNNSVLTASGSGINIFSGGTLTASTADALISLVDSSLTLGLPDTHGALVNLGTPGGGAPPAVVSLSGPLFTAVNSTINATCGPLTVFQGGSFLGLGTAPLVQLDDVVARFGPSLLDPGSAIAFATAFTVHGFGDGASLTVAGPLLQMTNGASVVLEANVVNVFDHGALSSTNATADPTPAALVIVGGGSTLTAGVPTAFSNLVGVFGGPNGQSDMLVERPLLSVTGASTVMTSGTLVNVGENSGARGRLVIDTSEPMITVGPDSSVRAGLFGFIANLVSVGGFAIPQPEIALLGGPALRATGSLVESTGSLIVAFSGGLLTSTGSTPLVQLDDAEVRIGNSVINPGSFFSFSHLLTVSGTATLAGPLLGAANGSQLSIEADVVGVFGDFATLTVGSAGDPAAALLALGGASAVTAGAASDFGNGNVLNVFGFGGGPATVTLNRPLLNLMGGSSVTATGNVISLGTGAVLTVNAAAPVISVSDGELSIGGTVVQTFVGASLTTSTPLLSTVGGAIFAGGGVLDFPASLTVTGAQPLISLTGTPVTTGADFIRFTDGMAVTLAGSLVDVVQGAGGPITLAVNNLGTFVRILDGAAVTKTGADPLVRLAGNQPNGVEALASGNFFFVGSSAPGTPGPLSSLSLSGSLLEATNARITSGDPATLARSGVLVHDGATLTKTDASPLLVLDATVLRLAGNVLSVRRSAAVDQPSTVDLGAAPLLVMTNSTVDTSTLGFQAALGTISNSCCNLLTVSQGGRLLSTAVAPLIQLTNSTYRAGPDEFSGSVVISVSDTIGGAPAGELIAPSVLSLSGTLVSSVNSAMTALGTALSITRAAFVATSPTDPVFSVSNTTDTTWAFGGISPLPFGGTPAGGQTYGALFSVSAVQAGGILGDASATFHGPLLVATNTGPAMHNTFNVTGDFIGVFNGATLVSHTTEPFVATDHGLFNVGDGVVRYFFSMGNLGGASGTATASASFAGSLLRATSDTLTATGGLLTLFNGAALTKTGSAPLFDFAATTPLGVLVQAARNGVALSASVANIPVTTLMLSGSLIRALDTELRLGGTPGIDTLSSIFIGDGSVATKTDASPFVELQNSVWTSAGSMLSMRRSPSALLPTTLDLGGAYLLDASSSTVTTGTVVGTSLCCSGTLLGQGSVLRSTNPGALIRLTESLFDAGSSNRSGGNFLSINDTGAAASDTMNFTILPSSVTLSGGLVQATDSTITALFNGLSVIRSTFTGGSDASPVFSLTNSRDITWSFGGITPLQSGSVPPGGQVYGAFLNLNAFVPTTGPLGDTTATFHGPLLVTTNTGVGTRTTFNVTGDFIGVFNGATLTATTALPFVQSDHSTFTIGIDPGTGTPIRHFLHVAGLGGATGTSPASAVLAGPLLQSSQDSLEVSGNLVGIFNSGQVTIGGPVVTAAGSTLTTGAWLVHVTGGGTLTATGASPLVALDFSTGGSATIGEDAIFPRGAATQDHVDADFGTVPGLGTDQPLRPQGGGVLLEVTAARTDTGTGTFDVEVGGNAVRLDTALLEATAPLINLVQTAMRTGQDGVHLMQKARLEAGGASELLRLDRSRLDITSGNLVTVAGGSLLRVTNLLTVANGSLLNILNGTLLSLLDNSFARVGGCLVCFSGAGNTVNVSNGIPATGNLFGFPIGGTGTVQVGAGATAASVFPGLAANGNQLNVTSGVLLNVEAGSVLKIQ